MKEILIVVLWFVVMMTILKNIQQDDKIDQLRQQCVMKVAE